MENATKALLIAGAVLLVIMIISVGLMIFNSANGQVTAAISSMNQQEKDQFNNKFLAYEGRQSGSSVKTLIGTVMSHNTQMTNESTPEKGVVINWDATIAVADVESDTEHSDSEVQASADLEALRQEIKSGGEYQVEVSVESGVGLVQTISLTRLNTGT